MLQERLAWMRSGLMYLHDTPRLRAQEERVFEHLFKTSNGVRCRASRIAQLAPRANNRYRRRS